MEVVYNSRNNKDNISKIGASNAITVLNVSHYSFFEKDLSNIEVPGADLSGGEFVNTNFTNADLSEVNLRSTLLTKTIFNQANLYKVELGIIPALHFEIKIEFMEQSPNKELIAVGSGQKFYLYDKDLKIKLEIDCD